MVLGRVGSNKVKMIRLLVNAVIFSWKEMRINCGMSECFNAFGGVRPPFMAKLKPMMFLTIFLFSGRAGYARSVSGAPAFQI